MTNSLKKRRINIIRWDNQLGLRRDTEIIANILKSAGFEVSIQPFWRPSRRYSSLNWFSRATRAKPLYDINLFLEDILPSWLPFARINCLIPNQEWFRPEATAYLGGMDWVLCKTKHAEQVFQKLGCQTKWIGFTGCDRFNSSIPRNEWGFFHLASSPQKGMNALIQVWQNHPEWSILTIVQNPKYAQSVIAPNIHYRAEYISDEQLQSYQNSQSIHLCPSESEGFGHSIIEAMSCQAVVLTTNAPPMNEILTPERGVLVDYNRTQKQQLGINYYVDIKHLEEQIQQILEMDSYRKKVLGKNAREWFLENDKDFRYRFVEIIQNIG
ncbi:MAG: glycosyltransferase [Desertifilum sp.]|nr:glycosyltransferase [Desertifilum sp.]